MFLKLDPPLTRRDSRVPGNDAKRRKRRRRRTLRSGVKMSKRRAIICREGEGHEDR